MSLLGKFLGGLWLIFVAFYYFKYHTYYNPDPLILRGFIFTLIAFALLYLAIWFFQVWRKKTTLTFSAIRILAGFFLTTLLTMGIFYVNLDPGTFTPDQKIVSFPDGQFGLMDENVQLGEEASIQFVQGTTIVNWNGKNGAKQAFPPEIQALFTSPSVFSFLAGIAQSLGIALGIMLLLLAVFHNAGALALRKKEINTFGFFESVGIGMGIAMAGLFLLGAFGQLNSTAAWAWFILLALASLTKSRLLWQAATQKIHIPLHINATTLATLIPITALLILLAFNTVSMIRPLPIGFDSLILYHNTPQLLIQYQHLIGGITAYNYELLITWALLLFKSPTTGIFVVYLGGLLALALLFSLLKKGVGSKEACWWTTFFLSLPMFSFLLHIDPKVDLPLVFFSLLAIHHAVKAAPHLKNSEGTKNILFTGIFLGIAFGVKYTAILLAGIAMAFWAYELGWLVAALGISSGMLGILGLMDFWTFDNSLSESVKRILEEVFIGSGVIMIGVDLIRKKFSWVKVRPFILVGSMIILMMTPWLIKNGMESQSFAPRNLLYGVNQNVDSQLQALQNVPVACPSIPTYNELPKYAGNFSGHSLQLPLRIFWEVTISSGLSNNRITDISVIFLGLMVWAGLGWKKAVSENPSLKKITLFTGLYGLLWLLSANGIIWYGMPVLVGIIWIYAAVFKNEKWIKAILAVTLLLGTTLIYIEGATQAEGILYAGKVINEEIFREQTFPGGEKVETILNSEPGLSSNILWNGNFMQYLIDYNDRRVYGDTFLENFDCKLKQITPQKTLEKFHEYNIGYALYSPVVLKVEADQSGPLHQRFARFEEFARNYLIQEMYRPNMQLYRIP